MAAAQFAGVGDGPPSWVTIKPVMIALTHCTQVDTLLKNVSAAVFKSHHLMRKLTPTARKGSWCGNRGVNGGAARHQGRLTAPE